MRLNIFENIMAKKPKETELVRMVGIMKTSEKLHKLCSQRQKLLASNNKTDADAIKKKRIPAFAPAAFMFDGKRRNNVIGLTGICFLESDHMDSAKIQETMQRIENDSHILLALRSVSGDGLHIFIKYAFDGMEIPNYSAMSIDKMNRTYGAVFESLRNHYCQTLGITIDKSGSNMERLCIISYDPNLYCNLLAEPFIFKYEQQKKKGKPNVLKILNQ
ncbi:MAG: hypothetical protein J6W13_08510 [Salinivirgaceae bacterium]|nr:hypothetical protein [Salinivirgaceae bacterium]